MSGSSILNKNFHATISYLTDNTESFTSSYDADSESAPNLTPVAGTYVGLHAYTHTVTVDGVGTFSGHSTDGCTVAGSLSPRGKRNVFHTSVTFGGGACCHGTETAVGVAFCDASTHRLYIAALNNARTTSFLFLGTKR